MICALIVQLSVSVCIPGAGNQPTTGSGATEENVYCGGHCSAYECQLGAACDPPQPGQPDPCAPAGLVCDPINQVCRDPQIYESCLPGTVACEPFPQSTIPMTCVDVPGNGDLCLQACSQTSDCADPYTTCYLADESTLGGGFCNADECSTNFARCAAESSTDGICWPEGQEGSFCHQEAADGGTSGQGCDAYDNRQRGEFCAFPNVCNSGLCQPACNAGTGAVPGCPTGTTCFGIQGVTSDAEDMGVCSVACDFTSPDGGGCAQVAGGPPEKCLPQILLGLPDAPTGFCAANIASPIPLGQDCPVEPGGEDGCVPGALCLSPSISQNARCFQMCNLVSSIPGTGGCSSTETCMALDDGSGILPTSTGFCSN